MHPRTPNPIDQQVIGGNPIGVLYRAPADMPSCTDVHALVNVADDGTQIIRIPWVVTAQDVEMLGRGGTLWLSVFAERMPPVNLHVEEPVA